MKQEETLNKYSLVIQQFVVYPLIMLVQDIIKKGQKKPRPKPSAGARRKPAQWAVSSSPDNK